MCPLVFVPLSVCSLNIIIINNDEKGASLIAIVNDNEMILC